MNTINKKRTALLIYAVLAFFVLAFFAGCKAEVDDDLLGGSRAQTALAAPDEPIVTPADSQLTVDWDAVDGAVSYEVWISESEDVETAEQYGCDITDATSVIITELSNGKPYYIWIKAKNANETSEFSEPASGTPFEPIGPPAAPQQPDLTPANRQIAAEWGAVTGATSYEVWINTTDNSATSAKYGTDVNEISATITSLTNGTLYYVWIAAKNSVGTSTFSPAASGTPVAPPVAPNKPPVLTSDNGQLIVKWDEVPGAVSYEVWKSTTDNSGTAEQYGGDIDGTSTIITNLVNGTVYYIWIKAKNIGGTSPFSPMASGTPDIFPGLKLTINTGSDDADFILPVRAIVTGLNLSIDWGDGSAETATTAPTQFNGIPHTYPALNTDYTISLTGSCMTDTEVYGKCGLGFDDLAADMGFNAHSNREKIIKAEGNITELTTESTQTKMAYRFLFAGCTNLSDISGLVFSETSAGILFLDSAFNGCTALESLPDNFLINVAAADIGFLEGAFRGCTALKNLPHNFLANVAAAGDAFFLGTFQECVSLDYIDLFSDGNAFDTADYEHFMGNAFTDAASSTNPLTLRIHGTTALHVQDSAGLTNENVREIQVASDLLSEYRSLPNWDEIDDNKFVALRN